MSCPNCKNFHNLCKASCCGPVPINKIIWQQNQHNIQTPPTEIIDITDADILPITSTASCPFLTKELACAIYNDRPDVCKLFGNETHINLTCSYQKASGEPRSFHERIKIQKKQTQTLIKKLSQK